MTHTGCSNTRIWYSEKRKSKIFRGLRPLDPRQGLYPCTPPGALRRAPGPHPKSARAYALAMCAPRTCLPPKKIGSRLRARYVRSAHMFAPKKIGPQQFKKIGSRFALAMCATRTCLPPHNQSLFKSSCRHCIEAEIGARVLHRDEPATVYLSATAV